MPSTRSEESSDSTPQSGFDALMKHVYLHKIEMALWGSRALTMIFTILYFIPIFGNPYNLYYKALVANAATSALRLHQRQPPLSLTRMFIVAILHEDSFHYLAYSIIFLFAAPFSLSLMPIFLFSLLHFSSYSLSLLDALGQNSWWGARLLISLVEFQSRNILRLIASAEILLLPFTLILIFTARAGIMMPFLYYQFLMMRYRSHRNPYTKNMFHELRQVLEQVAHAPATPGFLKSFIHSSIQVACRLGPQEVLHQNQQ